MTSNRSLYTRLLGVALLGALATSGCGEDTDSKSSANTIVDVAKGAGSFTTLVGALEKTGLDKTLRGAGPFTVFAPTDAAFALLPPSVLASLDNETLSTILTYHVYAGKAMASTVVTLPSANTVQGEPVSILVSGGSVFLNGMAKVTTTDIAADNGVIHVIDAVLLPPSIPFPGTIVDALKASPTFSTLVSAVVTAELATTLAGDNSGQGFTVFAPMNGAFDKLGIELSTVDKATLTNVLLYHVAGSKVPASQVVKLSSAPTLEGASVSIAVAGGKVKLDGEATVVRTDLNTTNGIIHIIDTVLMP